MSYGKKVEPELSDMPLKTTALVIIDMQNDAMAMVPAGREVIPAIRRILDVCRASDISIIHKIRVHRSDGIDVELFRAEMFKRNPFLVNGTSGAEIVFELKPHEGEFVISGNRFSGFFQTDLQIVLSRLGVKRLIICGIQTPNCIRATVTDAIAYDYDVVLLKDAISAQTPEVHEANLFDMKNMGVTIMTLDEFLSSLQ